MNETTPSEPRKLLPALTQQTAIERRFAARILKLSPGLGEKTIAIANALADSGMSAGASAMMIDAVYSPTDALGRGQGTRARWFIETVKHRYGYKLDKIRNDPTQFKTFIADMEEVVEMRDILNGEGVSISFQAAFLLWELGINAESAMSMISNLDMMYPTKALVKAAQAVKSGHFMSIEAALEFMTYGRDWKTD